MNIATLLKAADYLERKDREAEHGYATSLPMPIVQSSRRKSKNRKIQGSRTSHNELEKNRRAHLRHCLESLKRVVPLSSENTRHTTLGLLIEAQMLIKNLEQHEKEQKALREQLKQEQKYLRWRLEQRSSGEYRLRPGHSLSECSTTSSSSSNSTSSEPDEVDVISYGSSSLSDAEDQSSSSGYAISGALVTTISPPFNRMVL